MQESKRPKASPRGAAPGRALCAAGPPARGRPLLRGVGGAVAGRGRRAEAAPLSGRGGGRRPAAGPPRLLLRPGLCGGLAVRAVRHHGETGQSGGEWRAATAASWRGAGRQRSGTACPPRPGTGRAALGLGAGEPARSASAAARAPCTQLAPRARPSARLPCSPPRCGLALLPSSLRSRAGVRGARFVEPPGLGTLSRPVCVSEVGGPHP